MLPPLLHRDVSSTSLLLDSEPCCNMVGGTQKSADSSKVAVIATETQLMVLVTPPASILLHDTSVHSELS